MYPFARCGRSCELSAAWNKTPLFTEPRGECKESRSTRAFFARATLFRTPAYPPPPRLFSTVLSFRIAVTRQSRSWGLDCVTRLATSNARAYPLKMKSSPSRNLISTVIARTRMLAVYESIRRFHCRVGDLERGWWATVVEKRGKCTKSKRKWYIYRRERERKHALQDHRRESVVTNKAEDKWANEHGVSRN